MPQPGESRPTKEQLLSYYGEVCRSHEAITDFRAKLLALLPIASGTVSASCWPGRTARVKSLPCSWLRSASSAPW